MIYVSLFTEGRKEILIEQDFIEDALIVRDSTSC